MVRRRTINFMSRIKKRRMCPVTTMKKTTTTLDLNDDMSEDDALGLA